MASVYPQNEIECDTSSKVMLRLAYMTKFRLDRLGLHFARHFYFQQLKPFSTTEELLGIELLKPIDTTPLVTLFNNIVKGSSITLVPSVVPSVFNRRRNEDGQLMMMDGAKDGAGCDSESRVSGVGRCGVKILGGGGVGKIGVYEIKKLDSDGINGEGVRGVSIGRASNEGVHGVGVGGASGKGYVEQVERVDPHEFSGESSTVVSDGTPHGRGYLRWIFFGRSVSEDEWGNRSKVETYEDVGKEIGEEVEEETEEDVEGKSEEVIPISCKKQSKKKTSLPLIWSPYILNYEFL
ncbi:hypothetical protein ACH5RR_013416 [Cinchona calisaya]|uniref:Uncharacterized protein n=1 Tax=Cinchona calisaya TaxID=153742 RepID=A0ABD2ZZY6_9GENT